MNAFRVLLGLFFALITSAQLFAAPNWQTVATASANRSGGTVTLSIQADANNEGAIPGYQKYRYSWSRSGTIPADVNDGTSGFIDVIATAGGSLGHTVEHSPYHTSGSGVSGVDQRQNGQTITMIAHSGNYAGPGVDTTVQTVQTVVWTAAAPPKKYWVKFTIPYLATGRIDYYATQNGQVVGQHQVVAVMGEHVWTVGPLDTNDPVTLMQITGGNVGDDGTPIPVIRDDTVATPVSPPVTPGEGYDSSGASSGGSAGSGGGKPATPTPDAPDLPSPDPSPGPPPVDPSPEPNPSPSGGDGATAADIQTQTNQIIAGLNKNAVNAQASAASVVDAINSSRSSAVSGVNATIAALNNVKDAVDKGRANAEVATGHLKNISQSTAGINEKLTTTNSTLSDIRTALDPAQAKADAEAEKAIADAASATEGAAAKAGSDSAFASAGLPSPVSYSDGVAPNLSITFPAAFGGAVVDLNPFSSERFGGVASWFRTATLWLAVVLFGQWFWGQLGDWIKGVATTQQAKGNTVVAGTGGQATALVAAGLMTTAIIAAIVTLLAFSFNGIGVAFVNSSLAQNPLATMASGSLWMLNQLLPVSTLLSLLVAKVAFNMYAAPIFSGCAAIVRFIVP